VDSQTERKDMSVDKSAMRYLFSLPESVPSGWVLVHNNVYPVARKVGERGSRSWLYPPDLEKLEVCDCGWAPELGEHYRVRAVRAQLT